MNATRYFTCAAFCAALSLSFLPGAHAQFTYTFFPTNSTINSDIGTDFATVGFSGGSYDDNFNRHFTGPSSPTINVIGGSNDVVEMDIFHYSKVNLIGGSVGFMVAYDHSNVNISGGSTSFLLSFDQSTVNMTGGSIDELDGQGKKVTVSGGTITSQLAANSKTDYMGNSLGSSIVDVYGGNLEGKIAAYNDGILNLFGGSLDGDIYAEFGGTVNFYGNGLTASLIDSKYNNYFSLYSLSGTLADGTVLTDKNFQVLNDGVAYGHATFNLINSAAVPEPGSTAFLLTSIITSGRLLAMRRRKNAASSRP